MTDYGGFISAEDLIVGFALLVVGVAMLLWSVLGDTYDDRLEERSLDRLRRLGWSASPLPITPARRLLGVVFGLAVTASGAWWLLGGYGG
jgi:hypothetical protein